MKKIIELNELYRQRDKNQHNFMMSKQKRIEELENIIHPQNECNVCGFLISPRLTTCVDCTI